MAKPAAPSASSSPAQPPKAGPRGKRGRLAATGIIVAFVLLNAVAWQHAWQFTHFADPTDARTPGPAGLSAGRRAALLLSGVTLPRPVAQPVPPGYRALRLPLPQQSGQAAEWLGAWAAPALTAAPARGTVVLLHGYGGEKSSLLAEATAFRQMGYRVLLVDFRGGGASSGNSVTIGYREADDVRAVCRHLRRHWHEPRVVVFGVSMGAVAAVRAIATYPADVRPVAAVLECPFGSTYQTVVNRFRLVGVPPVPLAALLTLWGGVQHGYWAFGHDPRAYARAVRVPALLVQGTADARVTVAEARAVAAGLAGPHELLLLPGAGHGHYLAARPRAWRAAVGRLLRRAEIPPSADVYAPDRRKNAKADR